MRDDQGSPALSPAPIECAADECWLTALQLMAVQPACLKARQGPQPQQLPEQGVSQAPPAAAAVEGNEPDQYATNLLLHVQAELTNNLPVQRLRSAATVQAVVAGSPLLPLRLTGTVLELLILTQQSQVLHQSQYDMVELVLQQQGQQAEQHPQISAQRQVVTAPAARAADTALQDGPGQGLPVAGNAAAGTNGTEHTTIAAAPTKAQTAAVQDGAPAAVQDGSGSSGSSSSGTDWILPLYLHITFQSPLSNQLIDSLYLIVTVRDTGQQQLQQDGPAAAAGSSNVMLQVQAVVLAEVPLLVLPAVAQQEVQQLLLPAMRQEAQAEQQQQQEQVQEAAVTPEDFARQCLLVEHIVWTHFCNLANDICIAAQLASAAQADAAEIGAPLPAAASAAVHGAAGEVLAAATEATVAIVPPPATALEQIASAVLFPLLLPFLAAHGLHNLLQLLVSCLPGHLQQQWQEQQMTHLQHLSETAPAARRWPVLEDAAPATAAAAQAPGPSAAGGARSAADADQLAEPGAVQPSGQQVPGAADVSLAGTGLRCRGQQEQPQQQMGPQPATSAATATARGQAAATDEGKEVVKPGAPAGPGTAGAAPPAATSAAAASWHSPLTQFEPGFERRYLNWKHQTLSHLDYFAALFGVMYLAVLLKRSCSEPTTLFYCLVIIIKVLPHVPLILGFSRFFFRHRELLLFSVAPISVVAFFWFTVIQQIGEPEALLPQKAIAAYWSSRGELATSAMRPFTQHMRLRQYIVYCLLDAAIMVWVFGKVYGVWAATRRWGFACGLSVALAWGLDLHMRRGFAGRSRAA